MKRPTALILGVIFFLFLSYCITVLLSRLWVYDPFQSPPSWLVAASLVAPLLIAAMYGWWSKSPVYSLFVGLLSMLLTIFLPGSWLYWLLFRNLWNYRFFMSVDLFFLTLAVFSGLIGVAAAKLSSRKRIRDYGG